MRKNKLKKSKKSHQKDVKAFQELYLEHYRSLCAKALFILKDPKSAEDAVQDLFVKLWRTNADIHQIRQPEAYLHQALRNVCLDYIKKNQFHQSVYEVDGTIENDIDLFDQIAKKEMVGLMDQVVSALPEQCRVIFTLVYLDGKKYQEAADLTGISVNTVKTQLKRGMEKLREKVKFFY